MKKLIRGNEYKAIIVVASILSVILVLTFFLSNGSPADFFRNSIISLIVEIISVLATVFLLTKLLNMRDDRMNKEKAKEITKHSYRILVSKFFKEIHLFFTKEAYEEKDPSNTNLELMAERVIHIRDDIDNIIGEDFFKKNPKGLVYENRSANIFENFNEQEIDIHKMSMSVKIENRKRIDEFLMKYSVILPDDLRESLYRLDNLLLTSSIFMSPYELRMNPRPENINFNPEDFHEQSADVLDTLYELLTYFGEMEDNNRKP